MLWLLFKSLLIVEGVSLGIMFALYLVCRSSERCRRGVFGDVPRADHGTVRKAVAAAARPRRERYLEELAEEPV